MKWISETNSIGILCLYPQKVLTARKKAYEAVTKCVEAHRTWGALTRAHRLAGKQGAKEREKEIVAAAKAREKAIAASDKARKAYRDALVYIECHRNTAFRLRRGKEAGRTFRSLEEAQEAAA